MADGNITVTVTLAEVPGPGSPEASAMLDRVLAEYNWPSNPMNAARAGWVAAQRWLATANLAEKRAVPILGRFATWVGHNIGNATYEQMRATPIWHEVSALLADAAGIPHRIEAPSAWASAYDTWLNRGLNFELGRFSVTPVAFRAGFDAAADLLVPPKTDAAGKPMLPATLLEQQAIRALNMVKAWRDSEGNEPFPHEARELIDALLMMAEQRRTGITGGPAS